MSYPKTITINSFMTDPQYLAQIGHLFAGLSIITIIMLFGWNIIPVWIVFGIGVVAASIKEFWYDMKKELPKQTWGDSTMDFGFYVLGGGVGVGLSYLALHIARHCH